MKYSLLEHAWIAGYIRDTREAGSVTTVCDCSSPTEKTDFRGHCIASSRQGLYAFRNDTDKRQIHLGGANRQPRIVRSAFIMLLR